MALSAAREGALLPGRKGDRVRLEERGSSHEGMPRILHTALPCHAAGVPEGHLKHAFLMQHSCDAPSHRPHP